MISTLALAATFLQPKPKATTAQILEAVTSACAVLEPVTKGQDHVGFVSGSPALVGGNLASDDSLAWPIKFPTNHHAHMVFGAQKNAFAYQVVIEDAQGKELYRTEKADVSHEVSFQPEANKDYILAIVPQASAARSIQVVGILATIGNGDVYKPSQFLTATKKLIQQTKPMLKGSGFVDGMNLFAVPLKAGASFGPEAQEAGRTQTKTTMVVVSSGKPSGFLATLRTPDGALAGNSRTVGQAKALKITVNANANGHMGAPLHLKSTGKSPALFMGGIIGR